MSGLRAMQKQDGPWVRPLLDEPRDVLEVWARSRGLKWVEDPSNPGSQRGRLREIMPQLDAIHGGSEAALARSARLLAREDAFIQQRALSEWQDRADERGLELKALQGLHPALALRLLRLLVSGCSHPVRADALESVLIWRPQGGAAIELGSGYRLRFSKGWISLLEPEESA